MSTPARSGAERCPSYQVDSGRCELHADHDSVHATRDGHAYLTWHGDELLRWRTQPAPAWLIDLPWVAGHHPEFPTAPPPTL
jgi:hypothetical protein